MGCLMQDGNQTYANDVSPGPFNSLGALDAVPRKPTFAGAGAGSHRVRADRVRRAPAVVEQALVDVVAPDAIAREPGAARTGAVSRRVRADRVRRAPAVVGAALVNVLAREAVTSEPGPAGAGAGPQRVRADRVGRAPAVVGAALVDVRAHDAVAREPGLTLALPDPTRQHRARRRRAASAVVHQAQVRGADAAPVRQHDDGAGNDGGKRHGSHLGCLGRIRADLEMSAPHLPSTQTHRHTQYSRESHAVPSLHPRRSTRCRGHVCDGELGLGKSRPDTRMRDRQAGLDHDIRGGQPQRQERPSTDALSTCGGAAFSRFPRSSSDYYNERTPPAWATCGTSCNIAPPPSTFIVPVRTDDGL